MVCREKLVLASRSPRRAEILNAVGWPFEAIAAGVDETCHASEEPIAYIKRLARAKAEAVAGNLSSGLVLGADTVVVVDDEILGQEILGQPRDKEDALRMLRRLNGRWHEVLTGVALVRAGSRAGSNGAVVDHESTRVRFTAMTDDEIEWYADSDEPMDKAGAYAIQGMAALFIEEIEGDYFNIVGLPVRLVYELSQKI